MVFRESTHGVVGVAHPAGNPVRRMRHPAMVSSFPAICLASGLFACGEGKAQVETSCLAEDCPEPGPLDVPLLGEFTWFEAGGSDMGCTSRLEADGRCGPEEFPAHRVQLDYGYWIARFELDQGAFESLMGWNNSQFVGADHPVETVSLFDAMVFANRASEADGLQACYRCEGEVCVPDLAPWSCSGWRLPTEAEWERAARCGEETIYAGSDDLEEIASPADPDGTFETTAAGSFAPNACNLYDMSGNVGEWIPEHIRDYAEVSTEEVVVNPWTPYTGGASGGSDGVALRGGPVVGDGLYQRVSARSPVDSATEGYIAGFRLARTR
jgi:sulfatase modifying factor 1